MLEGRLVKLRPMAVDDAPRFADWYSDRDVTRYLTMRYGMSLASEEAWLREQTSVPMAYENAIFSIDTNEGRHIGSTGLHRTSPEDRSAWLGITIGDKSYWSRGYGTDAVRLLLRLGFEEMNLHRVDLTVDASHEAGRACYRKCGFVEEARLRQARYVRGSYDDWIVMGILREEWAGLEATAGSEEE